MLTVSAFQARTNLAQPFERIVRARVGGGRETVLMAFV
jgi:hypothetical protein